MKLWHKNRLTDIYNSARSLEQQQDWEQTFLYPNRKQAKSVTFWKQEEKKMGEKNQAIQMLRRHKGIA